MSDLDSVALLAVNESLMDPLASGEVYSYLWTSQSRGPVSWVTGILGCDFVSYGYRIGQVLSQPDDQYRLTRLLESWELTRESIWSRQVAGLGVKVVQHYRGEANRAHIPRIVELLRDAGFATIEEWSDRAGGYSPSEYASLLAILGRVLQFLVDVQVRGDGVLRVGYVGSRRLREVV